MMTKSAPSPINLHSPLSPTTGMLRIRVGFSSLVVPPSCWLCDVAGRAAPPGYLAKLIQRPSAGGIELRHRLVGTAFVRVRSEGSGAEGALDGFGINILVGSQAEHLPPVPPRRIRGRRQGGEAAQRSVDQRDAAVSL